MVDCVRADGVVVIMLWVLLDVTDMTRAYLYSVLGKITCEVI